MVKTLLLTTAILFFSSCNHTCEPKPDTDRVIKDTLAQTILKPFNLQPAPQRLYAKVEAREEKFLSPRGAAIKQLMEELKAAPQKFIIDNAQRTEITGQQGTKLSIKPNSFVNAEGAEIAEPVTIELKECYSIEAMLHENLLTGGFFASKGMLYVNAFASGRALKLKAGEKINVQWPFATDRNGYKLYYGNENADAQINWNDANNEDPKLFASAGFVKPEFTGQGLEFKDYLHKNISYPDEAKRNELSAKVEVTFTIDTNGRVTEIASAESYKIFKQVIDASFKSMPAWIPAVYNGKNIASSVHLNIDFNIRRADQVQVEFNENKASLVSAGKAVYLLYGTDLKRNAASDISAQAFTKWVGLIIVNR